MLQQQLEVGEILEQLQDVSAGFYLGFKVVLVEGRDVVVESCDVGGLSGHQFK